MVSKKWRESELDLQTIEAGGGGDCLFHSVAACLSKWIGQRVSMQNVRDELSLTVTVDCVDSLIASLKEDHKEFLPGGSTDLNSVRLSSNVEHRVQQLRILLSRCGPSVQGTDVLLKQMLDHSKFFTQQSVGVVALSEFGPGYTQIFPPKKGARSHYMVLYCFILGYSSAPRLCLQNLNLHLISPTF